VSVMGDESDLRARMRLAVGEALWRASGMRRISGVSLVALMCAGTLAPLVAAGVPVRPVLLAGVGVVGSVADGSHYGCHG
jgi:hypothetical protein